MLQKAVSASHSLFMSRSTNNILFIVYLNLPRVKLTPSLTNQMSSKIL